ncbi:hypothetical protein SBA3_3950005 [Candidatus Sulfopaludibacter sp. SbA3]|nr:hypothetical protein SBA3_3950005 [Candidatus Sulfopaludibacter sp. SbA3]
MIVRDANLLIYAVNEDTPRHLSILRELLLPLGTAGNLTSDAHLAALPVEHGAELCSSDTDFARFKGLQVAQPALLSTAHPFRPFES